MDLNKIKWKKPLLYIVLFVAIVFLLKIFIFNLTPFFLGLILVLVIEKPVSMLSKKIPRGISVLLVILVVITILVLISIFLITNTVYELIYLSRYLPQYRDRIVEFVDDLLLKQQELFDRMPDIVTNVLTRILDNIYRRGELFVSNTINYILNLTLYIPGFIIIMLFTIITAYFISKDKDKILSYLKTKNRISIIFRSNMIKDIFSYLKVQLLIVTNTTILTGITFSILNYPYVILLAFLSGILDLIPVIGPGGILWPMIVYNILVNSYTNAVILFVLYVVLLSARPILESKILGKNIGVHPVILLFGIYVGLITMGLEGIILAPISIIIFKAFLNTGINLDMDLLSAKKYK